MVNYFPNFKNSFSKGIYYLKIKIIYRWVFKYINKKDIKKDKLLEVGFGPGIFADIILSKYPKSDYHGIDYDNNAIEYASRVNNLLKLKQGDACNMPYSNNSFDNIFCWHVIEHLPNPELFLKECNRVLKNGGHLFLATPNLGCFANMVAKNNWIGFKDKTHISLKSSKDWSRLIIKNKFKIESQGTTGIRGIKFIRKSPLYLINSLPIYFFGFFKWNYGDAYCVVASKINE